MIELLWLGRTATAPLDVSMAAEVRKSSELMSLTGSSPPQPGVLGRARMFQGLRPVKGCCVPRFPLLLPAAFLDSFQGLLSLTLLVSLFFRPCNKRKLQLSAFASRCTAAGCQGRGQRSNRGRLTVAHLLGPYCRPSQPSRGACQITSLCKGPDCSGKAAGFVIGAA